jgi:hypothetical protein
MKVSRKVSKKVGRRSRKYTSSISHRRLRSKKSYKKNSYRKKHTQQGGKRGRGHKRARTHKRGKRFHRGGKDWPLFREPDPVAFEWDNKTNMGTIRNLRYNKNNKGNLKRKYDDFSIKITGGDNKYTITFTKTGGNSKFSFSFGPLSEDAVINTLFSAIRFGSEFQNVAPPPETGVTYTFDANEHFAEELKTSMKSPSDDGDGDD